MRLFPPGFWKKRDAAIALWCRLRIHSILATGILAAARARPDKTSPPDPYPRRTQLHSLVDWAYSSSHLNRNRGLRAHDGAVERVALDRLAAGLADQPHDLVPRHHLRRGRPRVVINLLLDHRAVDVVRPQAQSDPRHPPRHHDPVSLAV